MRFIPAITASTRAGFPVNEQSKTTTGSSAKGLGPWKVPTAAISNIVFPLTWI
jgi:hypothetical protein